MCLKIAGIVPHPPLLIPEVGGPERLKVKKTVDAMEDLCRRIVSSGAELAIFITPHGPIFSDAVAISGQEVLVGNFGDFGAPEVSLSFSTDLPLLENLVEEARLSEINLSVLSEREGMLSRNELDHGVMVPLYFLHRQGVAMPGLHITFGLLSPGKLFEFGRALYRAAKQRALPVALLASGDLSHRLIRGAPAGYNPRGEEFDRLLVELLSGNRASEIINMDQRLVEEAGECGYRSVVIALGFMDGLQVTPEILSYEGPFGVGYLVASFTPVSSGEDAAGEPHLAAAITGLARNSVEYYMAHKRLRPVPSTLYPELRERKAGVFVSIKNREDNSLRGCIGTFEPAQPDLAQEIAANAVEAAFQDPRFMPLHPEDMEKVTFSVDVLSEPEPVKEVSELDPRRYGIMVKCGRRRGLLLPALDGVDRVEEQLSIALNKAGISGDEPYRIYRFTVERYKEQA